MRERIKINSIFKYRLKKKKKKRKKESKFIYIIHNLNNFFFIK